MCTVKNWEEYSYYLILYLKNENKCKFRSNFFQLHVTDQSRFFVSLSGQLRRSFYNFVLASEFARIFLKVTFQTRQIIIEELRESYLFNIIDSFKTDELLKFLSELDEKKANHYLLKLDDKKVTQIKNLLSYEKGRAGAMMTTEYVTAHVDETVRHVLDRLFKIGKNFETIYYIYIVTEANELIGVASLRDLIVAPPSHRMGFIMKEYVIKVGPNTEDKTVLTLIKDYNLLLLPVVEETNKLIGIIRLDHVIDIDYKDPDNASLAKKVQEKLNFKKWKAIVNRWKLLLTSSFKY